ncbi:MAG: ROK family protein [Chitinispirillaceae bacterium]
MAEKSGKAPWVGFDLGGTKMLAVVLDENFKIIGKEKKKTKFQETEGIGVERIIKTVRGALEDAKIKSEELSGMGIGVPGTLDLDKGIVLEAPNLGWENVPLKELLEKELACPVAVVNDVDAGVYGEHSMGAAQNARCVFGIFPGTGIGGGCIYDGEILRGKTSSCMEIGHMQMVVDGPLCGCGKRGCLEAMASRLAVSSAAAAAVFRGDAPELAKLAGTDLSDIRSGNLAKSVAAGDKAVQCIVKQASRWIGRASAAVMNLLSPDLIVLGGGMVEAMPDLIRKEVEKTARETVMPTYENSFSVVTAKLGDYATSLGAAAWARHLFENKADRKRK